MDRSGKYTLDMASSQDASDHQDYYIFSGESLETFICPCYWEGATPKIYQSHG